MNSIETKLDELNDSCEDIRDLINARDNSTPKLSPSSRDWKKLDKRIRRATRSVNEELEELAKDDPVIDLAVSQQKSSNLDNCQRIAKERKASNHIHIGEYSPTDFDLI